CRKVLEENQLLDLLDTVVISSEMGVEKPEKEIFEAAFEQGNTCAKESLYVGDNYYDDVLGAAKVEMNCVLINPYGNEGIEEISYDKIISDISEIIKFVD
ncbi:HAD family hydrolase, partial [Robinsoniella sp.]